MKEVPIHVPIPDTLAREVARMIFAEARFTTTEASEDLRMREYFSVSNDEHRRALEGFSRELVKLIITRLCEADSIRVAHYKQRNDHPELRT